MKQCVISLGASTYPICVAAELCWLMRRKVVVSLDLEAYTARELADMAEYLYGKKMYGADKDVIISFLKQAP